MTSPDQDIDTPSRHPGPTPPSPAHDARDGAHLDPAATSELAADATREHTPWRRLDKRMLFIQPLQAVGQFLPVILIVILAGSTRDNAPWWSNAFIVVVPIVIGIWSWATTSYRITDEQLTLRQGLLQRKTLTARLDRVRTVDVTASLLQRLVGVAGVKIGTGSETPFTLAGLASDDAHALRAELLHVARERRLPGGGAEPGGSPSAVAGAPADASPADAEVELAAFSPSWLRFAPFSLTGLITVLAAGGFLAQFVDDLGERVLESDAGHAVTDYVLGLTLTGMIVQGTVLGVVVLLVASLVGYVLRYWGYRLTRHARGTLGVQRGLLTTREITIEEQRLRGVAVERPLLLRLVDGARADALVTGLSGGDSGNSSSSDMLVPPAPRAEVVRITDEVLHDDRPLQAPLRQHGPAAHRRRYLRAFQAAVLLGAPAAVAIWWFELMPALYAVPVLLLVTAPLIAEARYRSLGHTLTARHLVSRSGLFPERTEVVLTSAIIGWNITETFFQRRVGLVTLTATIAAGDDSVEVYDLPLPDAEALVRAATPGLAEQFMTPTTS